MLVHLMLQKEHSSMIYVYKTTLYHPPTPFRDLSDVDADGCLDAAEFSLAMHLIQYYLRGCPLPTSLPPPLLQCYQVALKPHLPPATKEHVLKCKKVFEAFHKDLVKGVLNGKGVWRVRGS